MADLQITNLTAEPGSAPGSVLLRYEITGDIPPNAKLRVARDGTDSGGSGPWKTFIAPEQRRFTFTKLKTGVSYEFTVTVKSGKATLAKADVDFALAAPTPDVPPTPPVTPPVTPPDTPPVTPPVTPAPTDPPTDPPTVPPTVPPSDPAPDKPAVTNLAAASQGPGKVLVTWTVTGKPKTLTVGRDGKDSTGYGTWSTTLPGNATGQLFTNLKGRYTFTVTPAGGDAATVTGDPAIDPPTLPTPPVIPPPPPVPSDPNAVFKAMTVGAAVYDAANGGFNTAFGKRHGLYSTWGANGKVWAYDQPSSEYGVNSVLRLGNYDLDVAPQRLLTAGWSGAAAGRDEQNWKNDIQEMKDKWGSRQGHIYYRPWHEANGDWYQWSLRSRQDQEDFKKAWVRLRKVWDDIVQGDTRFHLEWSPNRDSKYGLDLSNAYPDGIPDVIGPDYYDFALRMGSSPQQAEEEKRRVQNGNGPVGIVAYLEFAKRKGVPVLFPEWGVQFGDNTTFLQMVLPVFEQYRYDGVGDPAGKILGMAWHNLQGRSPDPNAGGDFLIVKGNNGYSGRPNTFRMMRDWVQKSTWLRTV